MPDIPNPFRVYNFEVEIRVPGIDHTLCEAAFAECDGLEMSMEVKTIRQGGENGRQIRLTGPMNFGTLTLKRGMTSNFDLWKWVSGYSRTADQRKRAQVQVVVKGPDAQAIQAVFKLSRCVPLKLKAPALNAKDGVVAIEELQLAYESLELEGAT